MGSVVPLVNGHYRLAVIEFAGLLPAGCLLSLGRDQTPYY